jgi:hypothetical protein
VATPPSAAGLCGLCRRQEPTRPVVFRQNVGVILLRLTKKVDGPLCRRCIEATFSDMTLTTFFAGWWGIVSFFVTPFILVSNISEYTTATRSPELRNGASSGKGRKAIAVVAGVSALVVMAGLALVALLALLVGSTPSNSRQAGRGAYAGADGLRAAEAKILTYQGKAAHGNTPQAERYAAAFSEKMTLLRRLAFTGGGDENAPSLTDGRFLTYCEVRQGKVCFLVHVPELRRYASSARRALGDMAWAAARQTVESDPDAATLRLGVGLRGILLYGIVMTGSAQGPTPPVADDPAVLEPFFAGPLGIASSEQSQPRPPAPPAATAEPGAPLPPAER